MSKQEESSLDAWGVDLFEVLERAWQDSVSLDYLDEWLDQWLDEFENDNSLSIEYSDVSYQWLENGGRTDVHRALWPPLYAQTAQFEGRR